MCVSVFVSVLCHVIVCDYVMACFRVPARGLHCIGCAEALHFVSTLPCSCLALPTASPAPCAVVADSFHSRTQLTAALNSAPAPHHAVGIASPTLSPTRPMMGSHSQMELAGGFLGEVGPFAPTLKRFVLIRANSDFAKRFIFGAGIVVTSEGTAACITAFRTSAGFKHK